MPSQLGATRGNCADCGIAGADAADMRASRFTDGAWLCMKCWLKEAPADRVCASCEKGVDTVKSWRQSKRIEDEPWLCLPCYKREVRTSLSFPLLSRERERATSSATVRFSAHRAPFALPVLRSKRKC